MPMLHEYYGALDPEREVSRTTALGRRGTGAVGDTMCKPRKGRIGRSDFGHGYALHVYGTHHSHLTSHSSHISHASRRPRRLTLSRPPRAGGLPGVRWRAWWRVCASVKHRNQGFSSIDKTTYTTAEAHRAPRQRRRARGQSARGRARQTETRSARRGQPRTGARQQRSPPAPETLSCYLLLLGGMGNEGWAACAAAWGRVCGMWQHHLHRRA